MSAKSRDEHNRWRNITVGFRVSPEENEQLNEAVALSGLPKQEYCYRRCMQRSDCWYRTRLSTCGGNGNHRTTMPDILTNGMKKT